ncbi:MAG: hypothetical protein NC098_06380 [Lachnoclostridium sp.]|nr:hypothetical protein [Lachnoclostridium sp.]
MNKSFLALIIAALAPVGVMAESYSATWELSNPEDLSAVTADGSVTSLITTGFTLGDKISEVRELAKSGADTGYEAVTYTPSFTAYKPATKVTSKTAGHCLTFTVTPASGHSFKPTSIAFDAVKIGTDAGNFDVYYTIGTGSDVAVATGISPLRNKIMSGNDTGYSHHEYSFADVIAEDKSFTITLYIMNLNGVDNSSPKEMGFRNVTIKGAVDEGIYAVNQFVTSFTVNGATELGKTSTIDLLPLVSNLKNGETAAFKSKLFGEPTDFSISTVSGYTGSVTYEGRKATVSILRGNDEVMSFGVRFSVTNRGTKPAAKPLKRGLMSLSLSGAGMGTGNLVSWRHREADGYGVKYKLYRGSSADIQDVVLNDNLYIIDRTNINDLDGTADDYYRLETYDEYGNLLETEVSGKTWDDQVYRIPTNRPSDRGGASYTPNDASYCDMDGDGEYEIILKWSPSNEKDAASTGTTSPVYFDCYKLDGTQLWRIDAGPNFFTSAHTMQFIAWDFDGDGYGEFMMKTAPGTIDGEGNYVLLGDDDPEANLLNSRGKQVSGPEYITVFDGLTGAELATIPYHTDYKAGESYWGDSNQNRSERYLAALAYLDGPDANPSPIFARGYYSGAFVGAYDWDGTTLKERWVSRNTKSGEGLWGEGAHWIAVGDCDGDNKQEIVYGSAALDHDGSLLYRTGLKHGDALHLGDFLPDRPGLEVFMVHEDKPYGCDLRDAATGELLIHQTASGDTGRGVAGHFDSTKPNSQFSHSSDPGMHDCLTGERYTDEWNPGGGGSMNNRIYWDGDLYDEHFDKSCLAKWNSESNSFWRIKVNNTNYTIGKLNNSSKYNPCVLGDLLGDWREELVLWDENTFELLINATSYTSDYRIPHLMDDLNYRVQVVNQNCCYNQPPHLSVDPAIVYATNPNVASQDDMESSGIDVIASPENETEDVIYNLQGIRIKNITTPGIYIRNGKKVAIR